MVGLTPGTIQEDAASRQRLTVWLALLTAGTFLLYQTVLQFEFISIDDGIFILENPFIQQGLTWNSFKWAWTADLTHQAVNLDYWQPLTVLSRILDIEFFGADAGAHHGVNLLLHLLNTVLLARLLFRLGFPVAEVFIMAAFFAWHPVQVETVAWVSARKDLLAVCFGLLTLQAHLSYRSRPSAARYALVLILFLLSLLAKPSLMLLPVLLTASDLLNVPAVARPPRLNRILTEKIPFGILSLLSVFLVQSALGREVSRGGAWTAEHVCAMFFFQIRKILLPENLTIYHSEFPLAYDFLALLAGALMLAVLAGAVWFLCRRKPLFAFGAVWLAAALIPTLTRRYPEDRFLYFALAGFMVMGFSLLQLCVRERSKIHQAVLILSVLLLAGSYRLTEKQLTFWQNDILLFTRALAVQPGNTRVTHMLARSYARRGDLENAAHYMKQAFQTYDDSEARARAHFYYAIELEEQGLRENALGHYRTADALKPGDLLIGVRLRALESENA